MSSINVQQYQSLPQGFGSGNGGTQQGQVGHMQQPAQQQQQAFMLHQHQMHNQRLIDEGILHGMQGQGAGKNLQESAANAPTHGTPPTTGWGEPPIPSSHAPNNWGAANIGPNGAHNNISAGPETPPSMHPGAGGGPTGPPPHVLSDGMGGSIKDANWGNPNIYSAPPPSHFSAVHGGGGGNSGMPYESNRGRGGRGGHHGSSFGRSAGSGTSREPYNRDLTVADSNIGTHHSDRGAFGNRGRGTLNRGGRGGRGGGSYGGPPLDHTQEKNTYFTIYRAFACIIFIFNVTEYLQDMKMTQLYTLYIHLLMGKNRVCFSRRWAHFTNPAMPLSGWLLIKGNQGFLKKCSMSR